MKQNNKRRRSLQHVTSFDQETSRVPRIWQKHVQTFVHYFKVIFTSLARYPRLSVFGGIVIGSAVLLFLLALYFSDRVPLNTNLLGVPIGGLTFAEAETLVTETWRGNIQITVSADTQEWVASPAELGLYLNAEQTIQTVQRTGWGSHVFGHDLEVVVTLDELQARSYFWALGNFVNTSPVNGSFAWQDNQIVTIYGESGTIVDIEQAIYNVENFSHEMLESRSFELPVTAVASDVYDPQSYQEQVERFVTTPFQIEGYDPFTDSYEQWTTTPEQLVTWLVAHTDQLRVNSDSLAGFINAINEQLENQNQYLDLDEATQLINQALLQNKLSTTIQIRHLPSTYEVVSGDTGFRISRKTGIPFFLIEEANPGRDLSILSPGDIINLPSRDVTLPLEVVSNKRIVVDLATQSLVAFEDSEIIFSWQISSGISEAPTSPGIYQILSHEPVAYGSSYTLCDDAGCGQWELNWFMGIYEAVPGLLNGFHGAVLLPNGSYLGGNNVGIPYTLGCVMSRDDQAQLLYEWAELGTVVEIVSEEFAPQSELAKQLFGT